MNMKVNYIGLNRLVGLLYINTVLIYLCNLLSYSVVDNRQCENKTTQHFIYLYSLLNLHTAVHNNNNNNNNNSRGRTPILESNY